MIKLHGKEYVRALKQIQNICRNELHSKQSIESDFCLLWMSRDHVGAIIQALEEVIIMEEMNTSACELESEEHK